MTQFTKRRNQAIKLRKTIKGSSFHMTFPALNKRQLVLQNIRLHYHSSQNFLLRKVTTL